MTTTHVECNVCKERDNVFMCATIRIGHLSDREKRHVFLHLSSLRKTQKLFYIPVEYFTVHDQFAVVSINSNHELSFVGFASSTQKATRIAASVHKTAHEQSTLLVIALGKVVVFDLATIRV